MISIRWRALAIIILSLNAQACDAWASGDITGLWRVSYEAGWWTPDVEAVNEGSISIIQNGPMLHGRSTLGERGDGLAHGSWHGDSFDITLIYSRDRPSVVIEIEGREDGEIIEGNLTAWSSDGHASS